MKICYKCHIAKKMELFHKHKAMADGRLNMCKDCSLLTSYEYRKNHPDYRKKENIAVRIKKGAMSRLEYFSKRRINMIGEKASKAINAQKRRISKERFVQTELDKFVIIEAYKLAAMRNKSTGILWHVDHIVPLNHKNASGLHNAFNIQVVPQIWNLRKSNKNMSTYFVNKEIR